MRPAAADSPAASVEEPQGIVNLPEALAAALLRNPELGVEVRGDR